MRVPSRPLPRDRQEAVVERGVLLGSGDVPPFSSRVRCGSPGLEPSSTPDVHQPIRRPAFISSNQTFLRRRIVDLVWLANLSLCYQKESLLSHERNLILICLCLCSQETCLKSEALDELNLPASPGEPNLKIPVWIFSCCS